MTTQRTDSVLQPAGEALQRLLGYKFTKPALLHEALTHRSAAYQNAGGRRRSQKAKGAGSNERLEFVGDRVLGLLMAEWLLERYPDEQEGALGSRLAHLVSRTTLAEIADRFDLAKYLTVAAHEARVGVQGTASVVADALEAVLGAVFLDGGLDPARKIVRHAWKPMLDAQAKPPKDPKTALQEWVLARGQVLPVYETIGADGPSHAPLFVVEVRAGGKSGEGRAGSKRAAESAAAASLLEKLEGSQHG
ncbi:ribonuclease III [Acetobacter indonesiensis NRIC 0313]|uniref:Ribonuclease 3 n=1 Tax=Acetobacter indonesiensis TaxID=104101 RepID=A0A6N3SZ38_9PROT|nr:ribonuclease III [Acetobacter indonesiensis]MCG0993765.1 ribonuclease III [Acetobacter indonesiensis]MCI1437272.1 ribonuclease III [Acetobacter indonesiensis]MCI1545391.1 ribonuclease III [Acetobacter indonesiensis]MCI1764872.1 ribonuclease III [Acetobacter indonesiensis]MCP1231251.1 ribonuclease III [Acetobacter indonesiensis]